MKVCYLQCQDLDKLKKWKTLWQQWDEEEKTIYWKCMLIFMYFEFITHSNLEKKYNQNEHAFSYHE